MQRHILGMVVASTLALLANGAAAQYLPERSSLSPLSAGNFTFVPAAEPAPVMPAPAAAPRQAVEAAPVQQPAISTGTRVTGYGQDWGDTPAPAPATYLPTPMEPVAAPLPAYAPQPVSLQPNAMPAYIAPMLAAPAPAPAQNMYPADYDNVAIGKADPRSFAAPAAPVQSPNLLPLGFPAPGSTSRAVNAIYGNGMLMDGQEFRGWQSMPQQAGFYTLTARNNAEFVDLWRTHVGQQPPNAALLPGQVAVFATTGPQAYTGHDVNLRILSANGGKVQVLATELLPSPSSAISRADVSPWKILIVRADNLPVEVLQRKSLMGSALD